MRLLAIIALLLIIRYLCTPSRAAIARDVYAHVFTSISGQPLPLADFKGRVLIIVNTASECGFTKQYAGLEKLYEQYKDSGLVVLGVPSNDFGRQEPGSATEIKKFCEVNFNISFLLSAKERVTGSTAHPFFAQVRKEKGYWGRPHWNFYKYVVGRNGRIVTWYSCFTSPHSRSLIKAVEAELAKA